MAVTNDAQLCSTQFMLVPRSILVTRKFYISLSLLFTLKMNGCRLTCKRMFYKRQTSLSLLLLMGELKQLTSHLKLGTREILWNRFSFWQTSSPYFPVYFTTSHSTTSFVPEKNYYKLLWILTLLIRFLPISHKNNFQEHVNHKVPSYN